MKFVIRGWFAFFLLAGSTLYGQNGQIRVIPSADTVERYGIYELTILHDGPSYSNPWEDVAVWLRLSDGRSPGIDINAPHWFERESELESDQRTSQEIAKEKRYGKLVMFGEQSNQYRNWDQRHALRVRLRSWTAFFEEGILIFWNSSFAKDYRSDGAANIYLGPQERGYIRVLQDFTANVRADVERFPLTANAPGLRVYGLRSSDMVMGYFHYFSDHETAVNAPVTVDVPADGIALWIDPATGEVLQRYPIRRGTRTLTTPEFVVDLALKIQF